MQEEQMEVEVLKVLPKPNKTKLYLTNDPSKARHRRHLLLGFL